MDLMRVMKHFNLLNCLLLAAGLVFLFGFLLPRMGSDVVYVPTLTKKKPIENNPVESSKTSSPSPQEYRDIADQNMFHPDRIIPPEKKPEALLPKPEFVLYGTLITPDLKMAYMEDKKAPVTTPGRGQRQTALMIGETLSGFRLKEIMIDKIVMTRGEEIIQVLLQEPGSSKTRESTAGPATAPKSPMPVPGAPTPTPTFIQPTREVPSAPGQRPLPPGQRPAQAGQRPVPPGRMPGIPTPIGPPESPMPMESPMPTGG